MVELNGWTRAPFISRCRMSVSCPRHLFQAAGSIAIEGSILLPSRPSIRVNGRLGSCFCFLFGMTSRRFLPRNAAPCRWRSSLLADASGDVLVIYPCLNTRALACTLAHVTEVIDKIHFPAADLSVPRRSRDALPSNFEAAGSVANISFVDSFLFSPLPFSLLRLTNYVRF